MTGRILTGVKEILSGEDNMKIYLNLENHNSYLENNE